jgi:hypothetical protein
MFTERNIPAADGEEFQKARPSIARQRPNSTAHGAIW